MSALGLKKVRLSSLKINGRGRPMKNSYLYFYFSGLLRSKMMVIYCPRYLTDMTWSTQVKSCMLKYISDYILNPLIGSYNMHTNAFLDMVVWQYNRFRWYTFPGLYFTEYSDILKFMINSMWSQTKSNFAVYFTFTIIFSRYIHTFRRISTSLLLLEVSAICFS